MKLLAVAALAAVPHVTAATPVTAVGIGGGKIAYATADCRVHLWDRATRHVTTFGRGPACERTSTGTAVSTVSVSGNRVLFLHYTGGNIREWSLWTATTASPKPRRLAFVTSEPDAAPPIVVGARLSYAAGPTVTVLRPDGSRILRWTAPSNVTALSNAYGLVVATADGTVYRLRGDGTVAGSEQFAGSPSAVATSSSGVLAVQYGRTLETRGLRARTFMLARGTRLVGATGGRAVIVGTGAVRTVDVTTGAGRFVARGILAAVDGTGLVAAAGRRVESFRV